MVAPAVDTSKQVESRLAGAAVGGTRCGTRDALPAALLPPTELTCAADGAEAAAVRQNLTDAGAAVVVPAGGDGAG